MVHLTPLLATAILSSTVFAAPTVEWTHPIFKVPISQSKSSLASAPIPKAIQYTEAQLAPFDTDTVAAGPTGPVNTTLTSRNQLSGRGIIGPDNRVLWPNEEYPYGAIGRVSITGALCSGSMVGRRLVATAKHCMPPAGGGGRFAPSYFDGERHGGSDVVAIISMSQGSGSCNQKEDWAIFVLADPVGDNTGYLGATVIDCDNQRNRAMFVGCSPS